MYRVLIADDDFEDRELLKLEITRALKGKEGNIKFYEAPSVAQAKRLLTNDPFDLLTLDIEFDRLNEGLEALPEIFDAYPTLNIIVISGRLNKSEVTQELFRFTKDNILKGKRWVRHFDVLDKKDDKTEAVQTAYDFALKQKGSSEKLRELFTMAESYLEADEMDKCMDVYKKIQDIAPWADEAGENIGLLKGEGFERALISLREGEKVVAGLLLGHHIELRLKKYTRKMAGRSQPGLYDCLKELEKVKRVSPYKKSLFQKLIRIRNKCVHHPEQVTEKAFDEVRQNLKILEAKF